MKKKTVKSKNKSKKTVVVSFLLDRTGSMSSCLDATISGFNEYINKLKTDKNKYKFTLTTFDSQSIDTIHKEVPLSEVKELNRDNYVPRSMTNLYDAMGRTINDIKEKDVLFIVMTDGLENASTEHTRKSVFDLIKKKEKDGWSFVYLGANQDAYAEGSKFGFNTSNIVTYKSTDKGTKSLLRNVAESTVAYASAYQGVDFKTAKKSFFSKKQKQDVENEE